MLWSTVVLSELEYMLTVCPDTWLRCTFVPVDTRLRYMPYEVWVIVLSVMLVYRADEVLMP